MKRKSGLLGVLLALGLAVASPQLLFAGEHGGSEHGGEAVEGGQAEGSHGAAMADSSAVLTEAAGVLEKEGYADLAAKLKAMVTM